MLYIWYPVQFYWKNDKDKDKDVRVLIDLGSKINAIHPAYTTKLGLCARKIEINAQKIDRFYLDTFEIVIVDCPMKNKLKRIQFFQETFLLANISLEVVLRISFLIFSKANIWFMEREFV